MPGTVTCLLALLSCETPNPPKTPNDFKWGVCISQQLSHVVGAIAPTRVQLSATLTTNGICHFVLGFYGGVLLRGKEMLLSSPCSTRLDNNKQTRRTAANGRITARATFVRLPICIHLRVALTLDSSGKCINLSMCKLLYLRDHCRINWTT
eukprot:3288212-Amphidinium_carterae.1